MFAGIPALFFGVPGASGTFFVLFPSVAFSDSIAEGGSRMKVSWTAKEIAKLINCSLDQVRKYFIRGDAVRRGCPNPPVDYIKGRKPGREWRCSDAELQRFLRVLHGEEEVSSTAQ